MHSDYPVDCFSIDPITGVLKPIRPVDFEKLQNRKGTNSINGNLRPINLVIQAQDHGLPSLSDETHVIVYVEDVNDFGPKFESSSYETIISEDLVGGSTVLEVRSHLKKNVYLIYQLCRCISYSEIFLICVFYYYSCWISNCVGKCLG